MLDSLSIRARFLIAPAIAVILTLILYLSSNQVIKSQSELFQTISESNLVLISEISHVVTALANSNSEIITLLLESESFDEEEIYLQGKKQLNQLYRIEKQLNKSIGNKRTLLIDNLDIFAQLKEAFSNYRFEAISAIEMSSVDSQQASDELILANNKLKILNSLFLKLSAYYSNELTKQTHQVEGSLYEKTYITELAITLMVLMIWSAFYFSKDISLGLNQVRKALVQLSKGDMSVTLDHSQNAYIQDIWTAVAEFKESIALSEAYKNDLLIQKFAMDQHSIIAVTDIKGIITYANEKFTQISGYSFEELVGSNHRIVNSDNQPKDYWREMYLTISKGEVWHDEVLNKAKDGHVYWVDTTIVPIKSTNKKVTGYIGIRTDITKQKKQQKKLIEAKIDAESALIAKAQFLATMSHEIRTPMNGVLGMLRSLLNDDLSSKQKHRAEVANNSARSLLTLIDDILDFSKVDAGKMELELVSFNIFSMLDQFTEAMKFQAQQKGLKLTLDTSGISDPMVIGDSGRIRQILTNIVGNAIKFTQEGEINIEASLYELSDDKWRFFCKVRDTGAGIPNSKLNTLFDLFNQVDASTTRKYGGTGLGLAISKKLCQLMQGGIEVSSEDNKGSCFSFTIQLSKAESPQQNNTVPKQEPASPEKPDELTWPLGTRLLMVEDNHINQLVAQNLLEMIGLEIETTNNGIHALEQLKQSNKNQPFTLILMDCLMPEMDGYETSRQIRAAQAGEHYKAVPIIALTANAMKGDKEKCLDAGMSDYLTKPIDPDLLIEKLRYWLIENTDKT